MELNVEGHAHPVDGAWIVSSAQMDDNRAVVCSNSLTATYKFASFHTMVWLENVSATNHLLGRSQQWQQDCGPAPLIGAAHANGTFSETAPFGTTEIRLVQAADYHLDFSNLVGPIEVVLNALGLGGSSGPVDIPQDPSTPGDTTVPPPDWTDNTALKGRVAVTITNAH